MAAKTGHKLPVSNPFEALHQYGAGVQDFGGDLINQLDFFGTRETTSKPHPKSGEMRAGQEIKLGKSKDKAQTAEKPKRVDVQAAMQYHEQFRSTESHLSMKETAEVKRAIEEIKQELQRLVASSKVLQTEFGQVAFAQTPTTPGKYHVNFFQWVLTVIRQARMKVEDAGAWQASMKGKKGKKDFWSRAKSSNEGTSFLLHHDRNVATQAG